ncbi:MAG TPA: DUF6600 domain-containing protein, partial [Candidatus Acidoferrales bacterium]|nr:DUF6600 domain-containing protein [Candidatus Acidoferrales bacterium]
MSQRNTGLVLAVVGLAGLCLLPLAAVAYDYSYARVVRLSLVEGDVQVARPDQQGWEQAVANLPIQQGFSMATGGGRAEVEFESGATARIAENSVLEFTELALSNGARISKLTLTQGVGTFYANLAHEDSFVVRTPQLEVAIASNARFRLDVYDDVTTVSVLKGEVEVDSAAGTNRVTKGYTLSYRGSDAGSVSIGRNAEPDSWDRWVAERDEQVRAGSTASQHYVDTQYSYGVSDLSSYGSWYSLAGYGNCWQPYGLGYNWSPYSYGRWAFFPGLGWTWISFERWGWLPYHFGSWVFSPTLGWLWVPGRFRHWQPAAVSWVRVGNRVGWVPLAPQDRPGQTPANLQRGFVSVGPSQGVSTPTHLRVPLDPREQAQVLSTPPAELVASMRTSTTVRTGPPPAARPEVSKGTRTIIFDPRTHTYVNGPSRPGHSDSKAGDARMGNEAIPPQRGFTVTSPQSPGAQPTAPPLSTPTRPARPDGKAGDARMGSEAIPPQRRGFTVTPPQSPGAQPTAPSPTKPTRPA